MEAVKLVRGCPCGEEHLIGDDVFGKLVSPTASKVYTLPIQVPDFGTWLVPRVFIACHRDAIEPLKLPEAALRYGFERMP